MLSILHNMLHSNVYLRHVHLFIFYILAHIFTFKSRIKYEKSYKKMEYNSSILNILFYNKQLTKIIIRGYILTFYKVVTYTRYKFRYSYDQPTK